MWRILKWTFLVTALVVVSGFITGVAHVSNQMHQEMLARQRDEQARAEAAADFARLGPVDRRLAIYDTFCHAITDTYFDPNYSGVDWAAVRKDWRPKAAAARDDRQLYEEVLHPIAGMFPVSHVTLYYSVAAMDAAQVDGPHKLPIDGIGIVPALLQRGRQRLVVVNEVVRGSPAEHAGVTPGWMIEKWEDGAAPKMLAVDFIRLDAPAQMLEAQETLAWKVPTGVGALDEKRARMEQLRITLNIPVQEPPPIPQFAIRKYPGDVLYVNLVSFDDPPATLDRMYDALDDSPAALILDLRRNVGGQLAAFTRFAEHMLPPGTLYGYAMEKNGRREMRTSAEARGFDRPVVVLVSPSTYSAGELAAAIMHLKSAPLVGGMTAGAVLITHLAHLPDGGAIGVPFNEFMLPDGTQIEGKGLRPDIPVFATLEDVRAGRDAVLERALAELGNRLARR